MMLDLANDCPAAVAEDTAEEVLVLPIPSVLDSGAAILLHLLLQGFFDRTVVLDAGALRTFGEVGALLLASSLMRRSRWAPTPRIVNLSYPLRLELSRHPLRNFLEDSPPLPVAHESIAVG